MCTRSSILAAAFRFASFLEVPLPECGEGVAGVGIAKRPVLSLQVILGLKSLNGMSMHMGAESLSLARREGKMGRGKEDTGAGAKQGVAEHRDRA